MPANWLTYWLCFHASLQHISISPHMCWKWHVTSPITERAGKWWRAGGNVEKGVFENHRSSNVLEKQPFLWVCKPGLWIYFTNNGFRAPEQAGWKCWVSEESAQLGYLQVKVLMSGLNRVFPPPQGGGEAPRMGLWGCTELGGIRLASSQRWGGANLQLKSGSRWWELVLEQGRGDCGVEYSSCDGHLHRCQTASTSELLCQLPASISRTHQQMVLWSWLEKKDHLIMSSGLLKACTLSCNLFLGMRDGSSLSRPSDQSKRETGWLLLPTPSTHS